MKLKASIDYGARTILYLAAKGGTCSSREISEEMAVPRDYLIQLALKLRNAGLLEAHPGKNGGYALARKPSAITVGDILDAFDDHLKHARQPMKPNSKASDVAIDVRVLHGMVSESFNCYLDTITVQHLLDMYREEGSSDAVLAEALEKEAIRLRKRRESSAR